MRKKTKKKSRSQAMKERWMKRIVHEKDYTPECAHWMAEGLERLLNYMQYGHAAIAYRKQDGTFQLVTGTLIYYENDFRRSYDPTRIQGPVLYWDVEKQAWRTFQIENFMDWKPII